MFARPGLVRFACAALALASFAPTDLSAQETVRSKAIVNFTFDEENGPAKDSATAGQVADEGQLSGAPVRSASPFWNQSGKKALPLEAAKQQFVDVPHSADVNRPDALSFSLLFVNLNDPADAAVHALVAKRSVMDGKSFANYGINFIQQSDLLQAYVNDGSGYKIVQFSAKAVIPVRKMAFVTATYQVADAPGQDADTDADDVRIQLFSNGEQIKPKAVSGGFVEGNDGWITDVNLAGLANTFPLSIGRSDAAGEYTNGVIDEFSLFPHALSPEDVKKLFLEVAGANVRDLIAQDATTPSLSPVVSSLSQPGIQIGRTTTLTISGNNLAAQPRLVLPVPNIAWEILTAEPNRLVAKLTASGSFVPGIYPLWVVTPHGISRPLPVAFDQMAQAPLPSTGAEAPVALPAAYYGTLAGGQQLRAYISGKKGQRIIADVELKRLGGQANPVLELKSAQGTPLQIAWGHKTLQGDARIAATLPHDGVFAVELHDLTYNAPGQNAFRLKIGDLKLMDAALPAVLTAGAARVQPIGTGFSAAESWPATVSPLPDSRYGLLSLSSGQVDGSVPLVRVGQSTEILETAVPAGEWQTIDATLPGSPPKPVGINGRLSQRGERDRYLLNVTPGQKLRFTLMTQSLASSVEGEIALFQHPEGNVLAMTGDQPTLADQVLEFAVPAERRQIQVGVRDLLNHGGERAFYRLEISPAGQPDFTLSVNSDVVALPENGTAPLELRVNRNGYNGPIALRISGDPNMAVTPPQIAEGVSGRTLIRVSRHGPPATGQASLVRLVGESVGLQPAVQRSAGVATNVPEPLFAESLGLGTTSGIGISMDVPSLSPVMFRGLTADVAVSLKRQPGLFAADKPVRFTLTTTEASRLRQPGNPAAGNFPMVSLGAVNPVEPGAEPTALKLQVPLEVAESTIDLYIRAEAIRHLYADAVLATSYSQPFRIQVQNAVSPKVDEPTLAIVSERDHAVTGQLQRTAGFSGPVEVTLVGLPNEYQVTAASVSGDQGTFSVVVKAPKVEQEQPLANVRLRVTSQGALIAAEQAVAVKVAPAK